MTREPASDADAMRPQLSELLERMEQFGCTTGDAVDYTQVHFGRYMATLNLLASFGDSRILELGGSYPYAFTLLLADEFPRAEVSLAEYTESLQPSPRSGGEPPTRTVRLENRVSGEELCFDCREFNIEVDTWPYGDDSFDLVLCMEIVEHLQLDPCFAFREAHRVLRPGGSFVYPGAPFTGRICVQNTGHLRWGTAGNELTRIGVMLLSPDGELLDRDFRRIDLGEPVEPGASREIEFSLNPPADAGDYLLRFDMVREQVTWFSEIRRQFVEAAIVFP